MEKTSTTVKQTDVAIRMTTTCHTGAGATEDNGKRVSAFKNPLTFESEPPEFSTNVKTPRGGCSHLKQVNTRADFGHFDES